MRRSTGFCFRNTWEFWGYVRNLNESRQCSFAVFYRLQAVRGTRRHGRQSLSKQSYTRSNTTSPIRGIKQSTTSSLLLIPVARKEKQLTQNQFAAVQCLTILLPKFVPLLLQNFYASIKWRLTDNLCLSLCPKYSAVMIVWMEWHIK